MEARAPITHELKCWPEPFAAVKDGSKPFEWRRDDRDYQVGDTLVLREWRPAEEYTGQQLTRTVTYIIREGFGIPEGYCIMGLRSLATPSPVYVMSKDYDALYELLCKGGEALGTRTSNKTGTKKIAPVLLRLCPDGGFDFQQGWDDTGKQYTKSQYIAECTRLNLEWIALSLATPSGAVVEAGNRLREEIRCAHESDSNDPRKSCCDACWAMIDWDVAIASPSSPSVEPTVEERVEKMYLEIRSWLVTCGSTVPTRDEYMSDLRERLKALLSK